MLKSLYRAWMPLALMALVAAIPVAPAVAQSGMHKLVIQVSDNDQKKWNLALANAKNIQEEFGKENTQIEIVAYGPGLDMVKLESPAGPRIDEAMEAGVTVVACGNTMMHQHLEKDDMLPNISFVKAGVGELMKRQEEGWSYIRP